MVNNKATAVNEIVQILDELCNVEFDEKDIEKTLNAIWKYYNRVKRHNYHIVSQYIIKKYKKPKDEEIIAIISENLKMVINRVKKNWELCSCPDSKNYECVAIDPPEYSCQNIIEYEGEIKSCSDYKELYRFLLKLYDHIQLEIVRLSEIKQENEQLRRLNTNLRNKVTEAGNRFDYIERTFRKTERELESVKDDAKNMYLQVISILGIFAAIVFAVLGGLDVVGAITSAFVGGTITVYRAVLVASMCTLFVFWIVFGLMSLARWTNSGEGPGWLPITVFSIVTAICLIGIAYSLAHCGGEIQPSLSPGHCGGVVQRSPAPSK